MSDSKTLRKFKNPIEALRELHKFPDLKVELCGSWVWVTGDTLKHKEMLKQRGLFWASSKQAWYFKGSPSRNRGKKFTMDEIRNFHGSQYVEDVEGLTA